jgi:hypothetical protein
MPPELETELEMPVAAFHPNSSEYILSDPTAEATREVIANLFLKETKNMSAVLFRKCRKSDFVVTTAELSGRLRL